MDKEKLTKADIIDMELYDFFELLAKSTVSEVMTVRGVLEDGRNEMLQLHQGYMKQLFDFTEETFDQAKFDDNFTRVQHCFALAMYLDKKIELCHRREYDLTPDCFKN